MTIESRTKQASYWYNVETGVSQWEKPGFAGIAERELAHALPRRSKAHNGVFALHNFVKALVIEHALGGRTGASVLDIGCGRGGDAAKYVRAAVGAYVGVDVEARALEAARGRPPPCDGARYIEADMGTPAGGAAIREAASGVDAAVSMFALHHAFWTEEGGECALDVLCAAVAPGGCVGVVFPEGGAIRRRAGAAGAYSNELFGMQLRGDGAVVFDVPGATPGGEAEPLLAATRLRAALARRGFTEIVLEGTPRQVLRRFRGRTGQRRAMHVPDTLTSAQWSLADLQYAIVARRATTG